MLTFENQGFSLGYLKILRMTFKTSVAEKEVKYHHFLVFFDFCRQPFPKNQSSVHIWFLQSCFFFFRSFYCWFLNAAQLRVVSCLFSWKVILDK